MRFNQLPESDIFAFLCKIRDNEQLKLSDENLVSIQRQFHSDIRSMINYIQTNQEDLQHLHVITNHVWDNMVVLFRESTAPDDVSHITKYFREISSKYCIDPRTIIKQFLYYIVRHRAAEFVTTDVLNSIEHIIHLHHIRTEYIIHYFILKFRGYFTRPSLLQTPTATATATAAPLPAKKRIIKIKKKQSI
jgi:replication factor C subunit 3/5